MIHSADNINFLGETHKFQPNPLHKKTFEPFHPYTVSTQSLQLPSTDYPYKNMRFDHLRLFSIPHSQFKHPHLKGLKTDEPTIKHEPLSEVEHLGIKGEMENESKPNEIKLEMGLDNATVKDFAVSNLKEQAGTETTLSRHKDEKTYKNISTLPFDEQYLAFLAEKNEVRDHNKSVDNTIEMTNKLFTGKNKKQIEQVLNDTKIKITHPKKTVVQPVTGPTSPLPVNTTNPTTAKKSKKKPPAQTVDPIPTDSSESASEANDDVDSPAKKSNKSNKKLGEKVGEMVAYFEQSDIREFNSLLENVSGATPIPLAARMKAVAMGIEIPPNKKTAWLKNHLNIK